MAHDVPRRPSRPKDRHQASGASHEPSHPRESLPRRIRPPLAGADTETTERDLVVGRLLADSNDPVLVDRQVYLDEDSADDDAPTVVRGPRTGPSRSEPEAGPKPTLERKRQPMRAPVADASPVRAQPPGLGRARSPAAPAAETNPKAASPEKAPGVRKEPVAPGTPEPMRGVSKAPASRVRPPARDDEPTVLWTPGTPERAPVPAAEPRRTPAPKREPVRAPVAEAPAVRAQGPGLDRNRMPAAKPTEKTPRAASTAQATEARREAAAPGAADRVRRVSSQPVARVRIFAGDDDEPTVLWTPGPADRGSVSEVVADRAPAADRAPGRPVVQQASPEMAPPPTDRIRMPSAPPAPAVSFSFQAPTVRAAGPQPEPEPPRRPAPGREGPKPTATRVCPMCNAENASDLVFCYTCGRRLVEGEEKEPPDNTPTGLGTRVRSWFRGKVRKSDP